MAKHKSDNSMLEFGSDSPLFAKKKQKVVIPKRTRKKVDPLSGDSLLIVKRAEPKKRGPKSKADIEEAQIIADKKRIAKKWAKKEKKPVKQKPLAKVKTPQGCKHILPAFMPFLKARWKMLKGTHAEAQTVGNYIQAAAKVCKDKRPKEYAELHTLAMIAKKIANERS